MRILILLLLLSSCGFIGPQDVLQADNFMFSSSDPYFDSYKRQFAAEYKRTTGAVISAAAVRINFVSETEGDSNTVSQCYLLEEQKS